MSAIKVKLVHGYQTCTERQCATVRGLGLGKLGDERVLPDTRAVLGMLGKIPHLVEWERVSGNPPAKRQRRRRQKPSAPAQP